MADKNVEGAKAQNQNDGAQLSDIPKSDGLEDEKTQVATIREPVNNDNISKWVFKTMYSKLGESRQPYKAIFSEFKNNKEWRPPQFSSIYWKKNADKNRYSDQMCMDQTRVILKDRGPDNDYINASWMKMPNTRMWICTQGPVKESVEDFWHMIYMESVRVICMLCSFYEDKVEKTFEYFNPDETKTETFGIYKVRVVTKGTEIVPGLKLTVLELQKKGLKTVHTINHLWHTAWPDHYCPLDPTSTVKMLKTAIEKGLNEPIVVHCSAGIGRTGTFVGIDYATQKINTDSEVKMLDVLCALRAMRLKSIQSQLQYAFLHQCILEYFAFEGSIKKDAEFEKTLKCFEKFVSRTISLQNAQKKRIYAEKAEKAEKVEKVEKVKHSNVKEKAEEHPAVTPPTKAVTKRKKK